jgi:pterin-4a-carbinolamine dehydratase
MRCTAGSRSTTATPSARAIISATSPWGFLSRVALLAEKLDHHPEIVNIYDRVELFLTTDDVEGLSELDIRFAHAVDELAPERDRG